MAKGSEDLKHLYELLEELSENGGNVPSLSVEAVAHVFDLVVENQRSAKGFLQLSEVVHMLATFNKEEGLSILLKKISENNSFGVLSCSKHLENHKIEDL